LNFPPRDYEGTYEVVVFTLVTYGNASEEVLEFVVVSSLLLAGTRLDCLPIPPFPTVDMVPKTTTTIIEIKNKILGRLQTQ
jgi:hypothetical protein